MGTGELLDTIMRRNQVAVDDIVSILFSVTADLRADFPAVAARELGLSHTPLLCCRRSRCRAPWRAASAS